ncbi:fluoride efflux transporter FluC [Nocardioides houyundeii]|uniref:fluoride efflux transporter FluC n=1 Tax=Nocardioides houyundeii TaxID=2045452 RepID=UPI0018EF4045|nr:CrcB family protein [Nocardioides houyundeii]
MSAAEDHHGPSYLHLASIALVVAGGLVGVAAREGLSLAVPDLDDVPVVIPLVNLIGAFVLGLLYEALSRTKPDPGTTGHLKLVLGTGFCGGLTTYSSLATDTAVLLDDSRIGVGALYCLGTVLLGAGATFLGIVVASAATRSRAHRDGATS